MALDFLPSNVLNVVNPSTGLQRHLGDTGAITRTWYLHEGELWGTTPKRGTAPQVNWKEVMAAFAGTWSSCDAIPLAVVSRHIVPKYRSLVEDISRKSVWTHSSMHSNDNTWSQAVEAFNRTCSPQTVGLLITMSIPVFVEDQFGRIIRVHIAGLQCGMLHTPRGDEWPSASVYFAAHSLLEVDNRLPWIEAYMYHVV